MRDRMIGRSLSEGYRSILPHGVYPAALLFIETPLEEVDVNVHPAKTEVRFRRQAAVADAVREAVKSALASTGYAAPPPPPPPEEPMIAAATAGVTATPQPRIDFIPEPSGDEIARDIEEMIHAAQRYEPPSSFQSVQSVLPPFNSAEKIAKVPEPESHSRLRLRSP